MTNQEIIEAVRQRSGVIEQQALAGHAFVEDQEELIRDYLRAQMQDAMRELLKFANQHLDEFILTERGTFWEVSDGKVLLSGIGAETHLYLKIEPDDVKLAITGSILPPNELDLGRADPRQLLDILHRRLEKG